jgi:5'-3' exonuclease
MQATYLPSHRRHGIPVGTAMRFLQRVHEIVRHKKPERLAIFFDTPEPTSRQALNPQYKKAKRNILPDALRAQFPLTVRSMSLCVIYFLP